MGVIEMGWYANSFSISFDYNKRKDSTYLKKIRNQIIDGITGCIKHNGLYSDSGTAWECGFAYGINKPVQLIDCSGQEVSLMVVNGSINSLDFVKKNQA